MTVNLRRNAAAGAAEQLVVGLAFLAFYGILIRLLGAEQVGVLSLVLVLTTVGAMGNAGFGSAVSHFVPLHEARGERSGTVRCIETTIICTALLYAAILAVAYVPFSRLIEAQVGTTHAGTVAPLMIPMTLYVLALGVGSTMSLALTALQRNDLRLWAALAGGVVCLAITTYGAPLYGIVAGAWALAAQAGVVLVISWIQLRRLVPELRRIPRRVAWPTVRSLLTLGANMQAQAMLAAALEPISRLLIAQFAPLAMVTYFSMAGRYVLQVRALIYASSQPLLAAFSHLREADSPTFRAFYDKATSVSGFAAIIAMSAAAGAAPFVGELWIGERQPSFVSYAALLGLGWCVNALALVAYFNSYSLGRMRWNFIGHIVMVASNLILGVVLGRCFGAAGVVGGMALALVISGVVFEMGNSGYAPAGERRRIRTHGPLAGFAVAAAAASIFSYEALRSGMGLPAGWAGPAIGAVWLAVVAPGILLHPAGRLGLATLLGKAR